MSYKMLPSRNMETMTHSKKVVYLDATINPLLVSCVKRFGEVEGNNLRDIIGVVLGGSNYIIGLLLHQVPDGTDLSNEETFGALTLLITEQAYQLFQGNRKISVCTFPNQETVVEVVTRDVMIPSYHNAYFLSDLLQPRAELVNATNAAKIANGCKRILLIVEDAASDSIDTLEHSAAPTYMTDQFKNAVQSAARAVQYFNNGEFPITMRLNFMDKVDAGQMQSKRIRSIKTSIYSMPCQQSMVQQIGSMAPMDLQATDIYDLKNLISEKNAAPLKEDGLIEKTLTKKKITIKLNKDNKEKPEYKFEIINESEPVASADKVDWLLWEQHRMANSGKILEPMVLTIDLADQKLEDLLPASETNIPPMFDEKKPESSEKCELLIDVKSLNKLLENPQQAKKDKSKSGKVDNHKCRVQRLEREKALLDRAENLLDNMEKGAVYIPENKDQQLSLSLSDKSPTRKIACVLYGLLGLFTSYLFQIIF